VLTDADRSARMELFERLCHERGERCTVQRRVILDAVLNLDDHPTADRVFEVVRHRLPDLAMPTVYRTLEYLARIGVITKACHPGRATRYDPRTDLHHHLICLGCSQIIDFEDETLDQLTVPDTSGMDFEVRDFRVQLRGLCRSCRE
jgi:Fe2+ or Zn2+ uptake regulation protein